MRVSGNYKVSIYGASQVGKSCLVAQLFEKTFEPKDSEMDEHHRQIFEVDDDFIELDLLDVKYGEDEYASAFRGQYIRDASGFIVVYDISSRQSFEVAITIIESLLRRRDVESFPMMVVGNKSDLEESREVL